MARYRVEDDGVAGLTLALRLRLRGHAVALMPASERPLDEVFTLPAPYRDLFLKSGAGLDETVPFTQAAGRVCRLEGITVTLPPVGAQTPVVAAALGAGAAAQWGAFIAAAADVWSSLRTGARTPTGGLGRLARRHLHDRRLRQLLELHLDEPGLRVAGVSEAGAVLPYLEQTFGRWQFTDGVAALERELRARCEARGVEYGGDGEPIGLEHYWAASFRAPVARWRRPPTATLDTRALGLPWIGMAAEYVAQATPRAR